MSDIFFPKQSILHSILKRDPSKRSVLANRPALNGSLSARTLKSHDKSTHDESPTNTPVQQLRREETPRTQQPRKKETPRVQQPRRKETPRVQRAKREETPNARQLSEKENINPNSRSTWKIQRVPSPKAVKREPTASGSLLIRNSTKEQRLAPGTPVVPRLDLKKMKQQEEQEKNPRLSHSNSTPEISPRTGLFFPTEHYDASGQAVKTSYSDDLQAYLGLLQKNLEAQGEIFERMHGAYPEGNRNYAEFTRKLKAFHHNSIDVFDEYKSLCEKLFDIDKVDHHALRSLKHSERAINVDVVTDLSEPLNAFPKLTSKHISLVLQDMEYITSISNKMQKEWEKFFEANEAYQEELLELNRARERQAQAQALKDNSSRLHRAKEAVNMYQQNVRDALKERDCHYDVIKDYQKQMAEKLSDSSARQIDILNEQSKLAARNVILFEEKTTARRQSESTKRCLDLLVDMRKDLNRMQELMLATSMSDFVDKKMPKKYEDELLERHKLSKTLLAARATIYRKYYEYKGIPLENVHNPSFVFPMQKGSPQIGFYRKSQLQEISLDDIDEHFGGTKVTQANEADLLKFNSRDLRVMLKNLADKYYKEEGYSTRRKIAIQRMLLQAFSTVLKESKGLQLKDIIKQLHALLDVVSSDDVSVNDPKSIFSQFELLEDFNGSRVIDYINKSLVDKLDPMKESIDTMTEVRRLCIHRLRIGTRDTTEYLADVEKKINDRYRGRRCPEMMTTKARLLKMHRILSNNLHTSGSLISAEQFRLYDEEIRKHEQLPVHGSESEELYDKGIKLGRKEKLAKHPFSLLILEDKNGTRRFYLKGRGARGEVGDRFEGAWETKEKTFNSTGYKDSEVWLKGQGCFADVLFARDPFTGEVSAIKKETVGKWNKTRKQLENGKLSNRMRTPKGILVRHNWESSILEHGKEGKVLIALNMFRGRVIRQKVGQHEVLKTRGAISTSTKECINDEFTEIMTVQPMLRGKDLHEIIKERSGRFLADFKARASGYSLQLLDCGPDNSLEETKSHWLNTETTSKKIALIRKVNPDGSVCWDYAQRFAKDNNNVKKAVQAWLLENLNDKSIRDIDGIIKSSILVRLVKKFVPKQKEKSKSLSLHRDMFANIDEVTKRSDVQEDLHDTLGDELEERFELARLYLAGLCELHTKGVVHGDNKPKNIMFDLENSTVQIIDFGTSSAGGSGPIDMSKDTTPEFADPLLLESYSRREKGKKGALETITEKTDVCQAGVAIFGYVDANAYLKMSRQRGMKLTAQVLKQIGKERLNANTDREKYIDIPRESFDHVIVNGRVMVPIPYRGFEGCGLELTSLFSAFEKTLKEEDAFKFVDVKTKLKELQERMCTTSCNERITSKKALEELEVIVSSYKELRGSNELWLYKIKKELDEIIRKHVPEVEPDSSLPCGESFRLATTCDQRLIDYELGSKVKQVFTSIVGSLKDEEFPDVGEKLQVIFKRMKSNVKYLSLFKDHIREAVINGKAGIFKLMLESLNKAELEKLLEEFPDIVNLAAEHNHFEIAEVFFDRFSKAGVDVLSSHFLGHRFDLNLNKYNSIEWAVYHQNDKMLELLVPRFQDQRDVICSVLRFAALNKSTQQIQVILKAIGSVDLVSFINEDPKFLLIIFQDNEVMVQKLLQEVRDVDMRNELCKFLVRKQNHGNGIEVSPLQMAFSGNNIVLMAQLLEYIFNSSDDNLFNDFLLQCDSCGNNVIHFLMQSGNAYILKALFEKCYEDDDNNSRKKMLYDALMKNNYCGYKPWFYLISRKNNLNHDLDAGTFAAVVEVMMDANPELPISEKIVAGIRENMDGLELLIHAMDGGNPELISLMVQLASSGVLRDVIASNGCRDAKHFVQSYFVGSDEDMKRVHESFEARLALNGQNNYDDWREFDDYSERTESTRASTRDNSRDATPLHRDAIMPGTFDSFPRSVGSRCSSIPDTADAGVQTSVGAREIASTIVTNGVIGAYTKMTTLYDSARENNKHSDQRLIMAQGELSLVQDRLKIVSSKEKRSAKEAKTWRDRYFKLFESDSSASEDDEDKHKDFRARLKPRAP
jgi:serine/threonine protein kinase